MEGLNDAKSSPVLEELTARATEEFGGDGLFTYLYEGSAHTLTLDQAIAICGKHMEAFSVSELIDMLKKMHMMASLLENHEKVDQTSGNRFSTSLDRGREALERHVRSRSS